MIQTNPRECCLWPHYRTAKDNKLPPAASGVFPRCWSSCNLPYEGAPHQIAHLECIAATMHGDLKEARAGLLAKPEDERLTRQVDAPERLLKGLMTTVERLSRQE